MDNLRIYIAVASFYPSVGGVQQQALMQGRSLRDGGYEVKIITFRHDKSWLPHDMVEGVPVIRVAGRLLGGREKFPRILQRLLYLMAMMVMGWTLWHYRRSYDILHVHQLHLLALPTALVCRLTGTPMIITVHCADSHKSEKPYKTSLVAGPLDATAPWLQVEAKNRGHGDLEALESNGKLIVLLTRFLLQHISVAAIVLSSRIEGDLARHNFHLKHVEHIPNGVDIVRFIPGENTSIDQHNPVVVCVSRLYYQKGIDVLLQAWRLVQKQLPQSMQARLLIVGDGPLQNQLKCMVKALGIADSVEFAGLQRDIPAQLHRGTLAVLSSRWEGMPNALLEAMACGLPCVATHVSGSEDIIRHEINGLLVEPEDYRSMAQALLTLLCDPALVRRYGLAARATVEEHYSLEHITDRYVQLYHQRVAAYRRSVAQDTPSSASIICRPSLRKQKKG